MSSMILTNAHQLVGHTRFGRSSASRAAESLSVALLLQRHQQSRGFRFGRLWSPHFDHDVHRNLCRRHRHLRSKYTESLDRRTPWDSPLSPEGAKSTLRRVIHDYWHPHSKHNWMGCRHASGAESPQTPDNPTGERPGRNIEDAERVPVEHLLFGNRGSHHMSSFLQAFQNVLGRHDSAFKDFVAPGGSNTSNSHPENKGPTTSHEEYVIDPITNRRVSKLHRSPGSSEPIFHDGPPPDSELKKYGQVHLDPIPWNQPHTKAHELSTKESQSRNGIFWHRNDSLLSSLSNLNLDGKAAGETGVKESNPFGYSDLHKYGPVMHNEGTPRELNSQPYDDLAKYKPVMYNEDSTSHDQVSSSYDDLHKYDAFQEQEPESTSSANAETPMSELDKYGPVRYNEPDGNRPHYSEPEVDAAELGKYQAFMYNEPDGKSPFAEKEDCYDPAELKKYQPFMYNEPDGVAPDAVQDGSQVDVGELRQYGPFMHNEPDGKPPSFSERQPSVERDELSKYKPIRHNEPDGKAPTKVSADAVDEAELGRYGPVRWNEPDGKPLEEDDSTILSLEDFSPSAEGGICGASSGPTSLSTTSRSEPRSDRRVALESSMARLASESDAADQEAVLALKMLKKAGENSASTGEVDVTGHYTRDFPEDFAASWNEASPDSGLLPKQWPVDATKSTGFSSGLATSTLQASRTEQGSVSLSAVLQPALDRINGRSRQVFRSDSLTETSLLDPYSREPMGLETSYAQECGSESAGVGYVRHYAREGDKETSTGTQWADSAASAEDAPREPVVYKILAYDQSTQAISMAETTSVVPGTTTLSPAEVLLRISSPAKFFPYFESLKAEGFEIVSGSGDVLIFRKVRPVPTAESRSQSVGTEATQEPALPRAGLSTSAESVVNPIDMTGSSPEDIPSPATSRFASPTEFVSYELPPFRAAAPAAPSSFASGIEVRGEEPVFSGAKDGQCESKSKKSIPKRIVVGAAWVAGVSYALGVVGEYFTTGGVDGKGPSGL